MKLKSVRPGKKSGVGRKMTKKQEVEIFRIICSRRPWQVGFKTPYHNIKLSLWNRDLVRQLIEKKSLTKNEFKLSLSDEGVANQLKRWGFPALNNKKRGYDGCHRVIQKWLDVHYLAIQARVKSEGGKILWLRKMIMANVAEDMLRDVNVQPQLSMIAAISNQNKVHWLVIKGQFIPASQIKFLNALITEFREKIFLIREDFKSLESETVADWICKNKNRIEVFPPLAWEYKGNHVIESHG